ncbi:CHASE2 domain-containing protein [Baaleninema simplex]|uniref:CHASE2 domain-containing protein n=1 Tax=Baaleninema simplex TaxID=2862350 RepID=UPI00130DF4BB|nr:CHASE2 domain-containing protein [Baaleninema simplex]
MPSQRARPRRLARTATDRLAKAQALLEVEGNWNRQQRSRRTQQRSADRGADPSMFGEKIQQCVRRWQGAKQRQPAGAIATALGASGVAIAGTLAGAFQLLEWAVLDRFFQLRPPEPQDPRIVLVTIDERDITHIGRWPMPDAVLADLLLKIQAQQPASIGLHLYRDVPINPGYDKLTEVLRTTPNLIGMEKFVGQSISPPPVLRQLDRVALADMVLDPDGKVRRGLISIEPREGELRLTFAAKLALLYLQDRNIDIEPAEDRPWKVRLGQARIEPLRENDGGYARIDNGGYQILLNYRGTRQAFHRVSMTEVLEGKVPSGLMRDRIVIVGPTAASLKEQYNTPFSDRLGSSYTQMSSLVVHANLTSQLLSAALDGRRLFRYLSEPVEWLWVVLWAGAGTVVGWYWWHTSQFRSYTSPGWCILGTYAVAICGSPLLIGYVAFLNGWWIPVVSPIAAASVAIVTVSFRKTHGLQRLATSDSLTQVANRRYFDAYLQRTWQIAQRKQQSVSLILCDVDYFKNYNDTHGHPAGDRCLQGVARAIVGAVRRSDVVARYGGEEFAVVLPETHLDDALKVARRIRDRVNDLHIDHNGSPVGPYVTLSCGVASLVPNSSASLETLIQTADLALYDAKEDGRNTYCFRQL